MDSTALTVVRNEVEACRIKLDVEVPAEKVDTVYQEAVTEYHRHARIPGFRAGKCPRSLLIRRYGKNIQEDTIRQLVRTSVNQALEQEDLTPVTQPRVEDEEKLSVTPGQAFVFSVSFDTKPEFELPEYKGVKAVRAEAAVTEDDVQKMIDEWLEQRASYEKVDRAAESGDLLKATYTAKIEGLGEDEEIPQDAKFLLEAEDTWVSLREPEMLPGSTAALTGVEGGTEKTMIIEFPETFFNKFLAGKKAEYTVQIAEVHGAQVPELTDDMAQSMGMNDAAQMRENVRRHLESNHEAQQQEAIRRQVMENLMSGLEFALPPTVLNREVYEAMMRAMQHQVQHGQGLDQSEESQKQMMEQAQEDATNRLRQSYVLQEIAEKEDLSVSPSELDVALAQLGQMHKMNPKVLRRRLTDNGRLADLYTQMLESKAVERIIELADIKDDDN